MNAMTDFARRLVAATLAALMLTLTVAVPVMERGSVSHGSGVESGHDAARCGHGHDHRICTQVGANLSLAATTYQSRLPQVALRMARPTKLESAQVGTFREGPPSRAPPLA